MSFLPKLIKTDEEHVECLAEIDRLRLSGESAQLELLEKLVQLYEIERLSREAPDAVDAILLRMKQRGLRQRDLAPWLGGRNRVSEVLSRKRPLSLAMIRALSHELEIPAELLLSGARRMHDKK
jgi:HTH-type transcriptional regulator/antitoxin HigA